MHVIFFKQILDVTGVFLQNTIYDLIWTLNDLT